MTVSMTTLSSGIGQLSKLRVLELEENLLEAVPNEVGRLRELNRLILQSNKLTQLPRAIGNQSEFTINTINILNLHYLSGQLCQLQYLSAGENYLSFLPEEIGSLEALERFD